MKNEWVRDGLTKRGYRQKDLAVAWGSQQASVSRFLSGEELQDLPLSKALSLSRMLGITVEELAKGLGHSGVAVEPSIDATRDAPSLPIGTFQIETPRPGVARVTMRKDLSLSALQEIIKATSADATP